jgi:hypothetical protein
MDDLLAPARRAHREFVEATRAQMSEAAAGRARPPFARGGGVAVRSEEVTCKECIAVGASPEQSYLIHADPDAPASVRLPLTEDAQPVSVPPDDSERSAGRRRREITR